MTEIVNEILTVKTVVMDDGPTVKCPHCKAWVSLDRGDPRGEQYQHKACGGWFDVSSTARIQFHNPGD